MNRDNAIEETEKRIKKNEQWLKEIWDTVNHTNLRITEYQKKGTENILRNNSWKIHTYPTRSTIFT